MTTDAARRLYKATRTDVSRDQGKFRTYFNFPGRLEPDRDDHGHGPLATVVESFMDPGTLIPMHQHRNEDIVSWVPAGVMRHDDGDGNELVADPEHLMVMNAGAGFWHEEETLPDDPPLRMLQIFVRPHSLDLPPTIQHDPIPDPETGEWRHLFGPEDAAAPLSVRNRVHLHDVRLGAGDTVTIPATPGWDTYFYVFEGRVQVEGTTFDETESGLLVDEPGVDEPGVDATAHADSTLVAFRIDPDAPVTRQGTIGR